MATKREERKQRAEAHRVDQEKDLRKRKMRSRIMFAAGVIVLGIAVFLGTRQRDDGEEKAGRVWSAAHGHWHDK